MVTKRGAKCPIIRSNNSRVWAGLNSGNGLGLSAKSPTGLVKYEFRCFSVVCIETLGQQDTTKLSVSNKKGLVLKFISFLWFGN
ncbi:hypothetical protein Q3G72_021790 [Acer saccharum]|nr:hypothetical protein Q3G72_021790 [Acer saccharum]